MPCARTVLVCLPRCIATRVMMLATLAAMILLPFDGMLSIVVPWYGKDGMHPLFSCGIHQYQEGRWVLSNKNLDGIQVVPSMVDLR